MLKNDLGKLEKRSISLILLHVFLQGIQLSPLILMESTSLSESRFLSKLTTQYLVEIIVKSIKE